MSEERTPSIDELWKKILTKTDGIIHKDAVDKWISHIVPLSLEKNKLVLAVQDVFTKEFIVSRYGALLGDVVQQALGASYTIRLVVDTHAAAKKKTTTAKKMTAGAAGKIKTGAGG